MYATTTTVNAGQTYLSNGNISKSPHPPLQPSQSSQSSQPSFQTISQNAQSLSPSSSTVSLTSLVPTPTLAPASVDEQNSLLIEGNVTNDIDNINTAEQGFNLDIMNNNMSYELSMNEHEFKELSYFDVQIGLETMSKLTKGEKLIVNNGKRLEVDDRYFSGVKRFLSSLDNNNNSVGREVTISFIGHLIEWTKRYCNHAIEEFQRQQDTKYITNLFNLQTLLNNSKDGLAVLSETYSRDKHHRSRIKAYIRAIDNICNQDIEKFLDAIKSK
jgi:hypothetical protein